MKSIRQCLLVCLSASALLSVASKVSAADRDDQIESTFKNSYIYRTQLKNTDLSFDADGGVVTLKGKVDNDEQRRLAEDTARAIPGVEQVKNEVRVTNEPKESSDEWIATKVRGSLLFHRNVSLTDTKVAVNNGVVSLAGTAKNEAEKALAGEYAADVTGVKRVDNKISIAANHETSSSNESRTTKPVARESSDRTAGDKIDDASITAQLKYALGVRRSTSALHTNVTTENGVVTIRGEAKNAAEKDLVSQLAKEIDGVRDVRNNMTVQGS